MLFPPRSQCPIEAWRLFLDNLKRSMAASDFQSLVQIFTRDQPPLVWSLLVSVFGDLARERGSRLSSSTIGQITQAIGIKPEATRVALHRLKKEGWLQSERTGRTSSYFLTEHGHAETVAASPRIYRAEAPRDSAWLVIANNEVVSGGINVATGTYITAQRPTSHNFFVTRLVSGDTLPEWMTDRICTPELLEHTRSATAMLRKLEIQLQQKPRFGAVETAVMRVLIVHTWRRIVLRSPELPDMMFPNGWTGSECRSLVHQLLQALPVPSPADLVA